MVPFDVKGVLETVKALGIDNPTELNLVANKAFVAVLL